MKTYIYVVIIIIIVIYKYINKCVDKPSILLTWYQLENKKAAGKREKERPRQV